MKLTTKLILAFLLISLFSTGIIVIFTRVATNREFNKFVNNKYKADLTDQLAAYYENNQTWNGIENQYKRDPNDEHPLFFSITNIDREVIVAGMQHHTGETVGVEEYNSGSQIQVGGTTIGVLLLNTPPGRNPLEDDFIRRLSVSIYLSAIVTILIAFFLGTILSGTISRPIRELTKATHEMAGGKFGQQVPVRSHDEIGELAASFNKMNDDLARSFNLRKQMTADIAHELRTPLSLIIGHAEAVHDGVLPASKENFEIIREEADRLEKLVNDLRTLSLADAGELSMDFQLVDINKFLNEIKAHYMVQFNQKQIELNLTTFDIDQERTAPNVLQVDLDPVRFSQVVTNILDNALHYTPESGIVDVLTKLNNDQIEIIIQDNGEGVTTEDATHLFDRFFRSDASRTRDVGGSGLGLAIAKSIVEMHKGKVWAESEPGHGLKVVIQLPVSK